jgi:transposase
MIKLELGKIRLDGGTQPRKSISEEAVRNYTEVLLDGVKMPPVTVFFDGKHYWLADGFHRYHAHKAAGFKEIECEQINGTKRAAFIFSLGANATHGMPRTNEEKRDTVITALNDVEICGMKDREIAKICNVSHMTIGRLRKEFDLQKAPKPPKPPKGGKPATPKPPPAPPAKPEAYDPKEDMLKEMAVEHQELAQENTKLKDQLAIKQLPATAEAKAEIATTIESLRKEVSNLEAQLRSVTSSRNDYQQKNADLLKQVTYWKRRAEKAEKA